jgi:hypothetical protein
MTSFVFFLSKEQRTGKGIATLAIPLLLVLALQVYQQTIAQLSICNSALGFGTTFHPPTRVPLINNATSSSSNK